MKRLAAALISVSASMVEAAPVTVEFVGDYVDLPYSEKGFQILGDGAVIEDGLAAEGFFEGQAFSLTRSEGIFALQSMVIDRRQNVQNRFSLVGFLQGDLAWSSGPFNFETQEGQGLLSIDGFETGNLDELRVLGFGSQDPDPNNSNFVHFDSFTFDVQREPPLAPVPLPAGVTLLASAIAGLSMRRLF